MRGMGTPPPVLERPSARARPNALLITTEMTIVMQVVIWRRGVGMQTIQASEFKAKCLALIDAVAATGEILVVTKNGKPIAELRPYSGGRAGSPFGLHWDLRVMGDIVAESAADDWKALK